MKKLNELIIFFLDVLYSLKNPYFIRLNNERLQNELLKEHIKAIRALIDKRLNSLLEEINEDEEELIEIKL